MSFEKIPRKFIRYERYLGPDHVPENLVNREEEMDRIEELILPVNKRSRPVLIHGESGTGKTACVKNLLQKLESDTTAETVYLDCWEYRTKTAIFVKTLIDLGVPVPRKGKPVDVLYEKVERLVENRNLVVGLDGIGLPEVRRSDILYTLGELNGKGLDLVLVSSEKAYLQEFDEETRARLTPVDLYFEPYTEEEIKEILANRVEKAFEEGTWTKECIPKAAEIASNFGGNMKVALALIELSARSATKNNEDQMTSETVERTAEELELGGDQDEEA